MEKFRIDKKLARGPVGTSYAATLLEGPGGPAVAKLITSKFHEHPQLLEQLLDDVQAWIGFQHPNLVGTRGVGETQGRKMILFDHAPGQTLEAWLREKGPLEPRLALAAIRDVCLAMAAAHAGDLAVGDIRAAKVYFDGQRARLADPGLARAAAVAAGYGQYGIPFGHPAYLAPEVLQEQVRLPTKAADVYALGVLFHELLTARLPFPGDVRQQLQGHLEAEFPVPPILRGNQTSVALLLRMVAKQPQHRFRDGQELLNAIYELVGQRAPVQEIAPMSTQVWRRQAVQDMEPAGAWSPGKVEQARPVGPSDLKQARTGSVTGRLPKQVDPGPAASAGAGGQPPPDAVRLGDELGRGPVGSAFDGQLASYSGPLVVKAISSKFGKHPELLERILARANKAAGLAGPTIVPVFRVMRVSGRDLLLCDKVEGGRTLRQELTQRGRLSAEEALSRVRDIAQALAAADPRGLPHGDIRPEKVWVTAKGRARLADFGLAEASCLGAGYGQLGMPFGHPGYLAPEVMQEGQKEPTFAADAYALGILLYELVSGKPPYKGADDKKTLVMHLDPLPPPPKQVKVPAALAELIMRLAAKDPRRRAQSGRELLAEVERCQRQVALAASGEGAPLIEEFDPLSGGPAPSSATSTAAWAKEAAAEAMEKSDTWSREKLTSAPPTGPQHWPTDEMWQSEELAAPRGPFEDD